MKQARVGCALAATNHKSIAALLEGVCHLGPPVRAPKMRLIRFGPTRGGAEDMATVAAVDSRRSRPGRWIGSGGRFRTVIFCKKPTSRQAGRQMFAGTGGLASPVNR